MVFSFAERSPDYFGLDEFDSAGILDSDRSEQQETFRSPTSRQKCIIVSSVNDPFS